MLARCMVPMDLGAKSLVARVHTLEIGQSQEKALWSYWLRGGKGGGMWIGG